jgi:hypothetical protein
MRTAVRVDVQDTSTTAQGLTDAQIDRLINDWYLWVYEQGQPRYVEHNAATCGLTILAGDFRDTTTPTNYARIVSIHVSTAGIDRPMLASVTLQEIFSMRSQDTTEQDDQHSYYAYRLAGGAWRVLVHPPPISNRTLSVLVQLEPTELSADGDIPDVRPHESRLIARAAAADAAQLLGRPQAFIDNLRSMLPEQMRPTTMLNAANARPRSSG